MTSFLITASDKEKREAYAFTFCQEKQIDQFDTTVLGLEVEEKGKKTAPKQSIGIEEIKVIQQKLFLKPMHSPQKAIIIHDAHTLTTEAQNAMLKVLEEPPEQTIIVLVAESTESLLPTIISRCFVISLEEEIREVLSEDTAEIAEFYQSLGSFTINDALGHAERIGKSKVIALSWLEKAITIIREDQLLQSYNQASIAAKVIRDLQKTHTLIKTTNVNVRMALEAVFLSFVSSH